MKKIDLIGKKIGKLTVVNYAGNRQWNTICDCGYDYKAIGAGLRDGTTTKCIECNKKNEVERALEDHSGKKIREWEVIRYLRKQYWECKCDRGHILKIPSLTLRKGNPEKCKICVVEKYREEMIGNTFGKWEVIKYLGRIPNQPNNYNKYWECRCKCGKMQAISSIWLKTSKNKSCINCRERKIPFSVRTFNGILASYKGGARIRKLSWDLTKEQFANLISSPCYYTGLPPSNVRKSLDGFVFVYNGIDRLNSSEGYNITNCVPCHHMVNRMKSDMSYDEFINMCHLIQKTISEKNKAVNPNKLKAV